MTPGNRAAARWRIEQARRHLDEVQKVMAGPYVSLLSQLVEAVSCLADEPEPDFDGTVFEGYWDVPQ